MNGWESDTPPLRLSILGVGCIPNIVESPDTDFPLARQQLTTFYLDTATKTLNRSPQNSESPTSHEGHGLHAPSSVGTARYTPAQPSFRFIHQTNKSLAGLYPQVQRIY